MPVDSIMDISATGLDFQRKRLEAIANNIANAHTTRGADGSLYKAIDVVAYSSQVNSVSGIDSIDGEAMKGVEAMEFIERAQPYRKVFDPSHPDASADGFVEYPNVDSVVEMSNMMMTTRAYEANIKAINAAKAMALKALEIGQ